jgi:hypothetical protein
LAISSDGFLYLGDGDDGANLGLLDHLAALTSEVQPWSPIPLPLHGRHRTRSPGS